MHCNCSSSEQRISMEKTNERKKWIVYSIKLNCDTNQKFNSERNFSHTHHAYWFVCWKKKKKKTNEEKNDEKTPLALYWNWKKFNKNREKVPPNHLKKNKSAGCWLNNKLVVIFERNKVPLFHSNYY